MSEQIIDMTEAVMPASSVAAREAALMGGAAGRAAAELALAGKVDILGEGQVTMANLAPAVRDAITGGAAAVVGPGSVGLSELSDGIKDAVFERHGPIAISWQAGKYYDEADGKAKLTDYANARAGSATVSGGSWMRVVNVTAVSPIGYGVYFTASDGTILARYMKAGADGLRADWMQVPAGAVKALVSTRLVTTMPGVFAAQYVGFANRRIADGLTFDDIRDYGTDLVSGVSTFGSATLNADGSVSVSAVNGGFQTNVFDVDSSKVFYDVDCHSGDILDIQVQVAFQHDGKWSYTGQAAIAKDGDRAACSGSFDATSLKIYSNATAFRILVTSKQAAPGTFHGISLRARAAAGWETTGLFAPNLREQARQVSQAVSRTQDLLSGLSAGRNRLTSPDGRKWRLTVSNAGELAAKPFEFKDVLVLGNSLTGGWDRDKGADVMFGMAATSKARDWASLVQAHFNPDAFVRLHDAAFEACESTDAAETWINANMAAFAGHDLIVVQIGDNVNSEKRAATFLVSLPKLVEKLVATGAVVVLVGCWFSSQEAMAAMLSASVKHDVPLVDIGDLNVKANQSAVGTTVTTSSGTTTVTAAQATHPGDAGMQAIAQRVITALGQ